MRTLTRLALATLLLAPAAAFAQQDTIVIRASTILDGKGGVLRDTAIVVQGSKIVRIDPGAVGTVIYDLKTATVMPGWIDSRVGHAQNDDAASAERRSARRSASTLALLPARACHTKMLGEATKRAFSNHGGRYKCARVGRHCAGQRGALDCRAAVHEHELGR